MNTDVSLISAGRLSNLITSELPLEPVWIGPAILPKRCKMILGAPASTGKSFMLLSLARSLALGEPAWDNPGMTIERPTRVLLIEHELKPFGLQSRSKAIFAGVDLTKMEDTLFYVSGEPALQFSSLEGKQAIRRLVDEIQPEVLIFDPIGKMHYYDENSNTEIAKLMYQFDLLLKQGSDWGMSLIFSHHTAKTPAMKDPNMEYRDKLDPYNARGAGKWFDDPDIKVMMCRENEIAVTHDNDAWEIIAGFTTRQGSPPPDMLFHFNEFNDQRCRWVKNIEKPKRKPKQKPPPVSISVPSGPVIAGIPPEVLVGLPLDIVNPGDIPIKTFVGFKPV